MYFIWETRALVWECTLAAVVSILIVIVEWIKNIWIKVNGLTIYIENRISMTSKMVCWVDYLLSKHNDLMPAPT